MEIIDEPLEQQEEHHFEYAGFGVRVGALLIDRILLGIAGTAIAWGGVSAFHFGTYSILGFSGALQILYFAIMESSVKQATFGKMIVGIKVGDENGERLSFGKALLRNLGKIVSSIILGIGFLMAAWEERSQALHDKIAGTFVYYGR
ncbi:MAG: RDD family protein [Chitinophagales bacterium]